MNSGIYKLQWSQGYFYYGQSQNLLLRRNSHLSRLKKGTHKNQFMQRLFFKYGLPSFVIVDICPVELLNNKEQLYLDKHFGDRSCCNVSPNSENRRGIKTSDEAKLKQRLAKLGKPTGRKGCKLPEEWRAKIGASRIGEKQRPETIEKRVAKTRGKKRTYDQIRRSVDGRIKAGGWIVTEDGIRKIKEGMISGNAAEKIHLKVSKWILNTETGIFYLGAREAAASIGKSENVVRRKINRKTQFIYA